MTTLRRAAEDYLSLRRALGFKLNCIGSALLTFIAFCEHEGAVVVTADVARRWAVSKNASPARAAWRLQVVRHFAIHHRASDPRTEVPSKDLLPHRYRRKTPYLFSDHEVVRLLRAARELPPGTGLRPQTYATLFGLLTATGLRVGEALALNREDIDWQAGMLIVRQGKFRRSRVVPLHPSTLHRLRQYQEERERLYPSPKAPQFFVSESGSRLSYGTVRSIFRRLCDELGLARSTASRGPRIHDLRHRFAVNALIRWYQGGVDVERHLPELSTYLGHVCSANTYWYLTAVPELLRLATERLEPKEEGHEC